MRREGIAVARYTVEQLMQCLGLRSVRSGKVVRTTLGDANQFWVSDSTYVSTREGWQYVAFVIDVCRIVGWRQSSFMRTDFVLDALEQALYDRQPERTNALIHHSDRGSQYVSIVHSGKPRGRRNLPHWNGWIGLTTTDFSSRWDVLHLPKLKKITIGN